ncbi:MAG TPA: hypothetical protein VJJ54_01770 [Gemmatimonadales bacterium]|nr:hypothetical protein [Gemmatimonadales bacterium]
MVTMLTALAALSTPLAGQAPKLTLGLAYTVGGGWQIEALDVGYGRAVRAGPIKQLSLGARLGSFIDQGAIIGGAQGFVFGTTLAARTAMMTVAELGADTSATRVGLDLTLEATGYAGSRSPLPVGSPWGAVSLLPGLRFGNPQASSLGVLFGPTVFFGDVTQVRAFLGVRFDVPLARRERHP